MKSSYRTTYLAAIILCATAMQAKAEGDCRITRIYENAEKQMQYNSRYQLYGEATQDKRSCEAFCKRDAIYIPRPDSAKVRMAKKKVEHVEIRCSYAPSGGNAGQVIARYNAPVQQLTLKPDGQTAAKKQQPYSQQSPQAMRSSAGGTSFVANGVRPSEPSRVGAAKSNVVGLHTSDRNVNQATTGRNDPYPQRYDPKNPNAQVPKRVVTEPALGFDPFTEVAPIFRTDTSNSGYSSSGRESATRMGGGNSSFNPRMLNTTSQHSPRDSY
jgi:hypothetical protein